MSKVRVLAGTRKGAFVLTSDGKRDKWDVKGHILRAGRFITSKARQSIQIGCMRLKPADGSGRSFSAPTTAEKPGTSRERRRRSLAPPGPPKSEATNLLMTLRPGPARRSLLISGMTARSIPGNSSASGIWSPRSPSPIRFTRGWKTQPFFVQATAGKLA